MRLYIIRHADPAYPEDALSARGHRQARALAEALAEVKIDRLFSSPMQRALDTARYTAKRRGLEIGIENWMAELEAWALPDPDQGEIPAWELDPAGVRSWGRPNQSDWNELPLLRGLTGSFERLRSDSDAFLERLGWRRRGRVYDARDESGIEQRVVAAVCHCGTALTWIAHLLEIPAPQVWAGFTLAPCSVTVLEFQALPDGGFAPRCLQLGSSVGPEG